MPVVPAFPFAYLWLIKVRLATDDEDFELLEIGEHSHRHAFVPSVAFGLEGVTGMEFLCGFFGLADKLFAFVRAEKIISAFASAANLRGTFNFHFALALDKTGTVFHVPAERAKERVQEIIPEFGLVVVCAFEFCDAFAERFDETI